MASLTSAAKSMVGSRTGKAGAGAAATEPAHDNPFILPSDDEIFRQRELERKRKEEARMATQGKKIWEKTEYSSTLTRTRKMIAEMTPDVDPVALRKAREASGLVAAAAASLAREHTGKAERMGDFIAKKREMFLVQMSLDIKREEIAKLDRKAAEKEAALQKSEALLEEDAVRFDAFLKENDQQAHDAVKKAEVQTKLKLDKAAELKKIRHAVLLVTAERSKLKETLDDYGKYKAFLDKLTPGDWIAEQRRVREEAADAVRRERFAARLREWEDARAAKEVEVAAAVEADRKLALKQGKVLPKVDIPALVLSLMPPAPRFEDEPRVSLRKKAANSRTSGAASGRRGGAGVSTFDGSDGFPASTADSADMDDEDEEEEELPMYFVRPQQLLDIFGQLEEDNLFLIQNCQETEQQLEELRTQYEETAATMARQSAVLDDSMAALHAQLVAEESKAAALRRKMLGGSDAAAAVAAAGASSAAGGPGGVAAAAGASAAGGAAGVAASGAARGRAAAPAATAAAGAVALGSTGATTLSAAVGAGGGGGGARGSSKPRGALGATGGAAAAAGSSALGGDAVHDVATMEAMLPELRSHIVRVYERCGFKATASSDTISMLTQLEGKLESLIAQLSGMDPEYVAAKEKEKEKERRIRVREARMQAQTEAHEQRLKKMLERAQAPVKKRTGKPIMFRSLPFERKVVEEEPDPALEQEKEDLKYWM